MATPPIIDLYDKDDLGAAPIFQGGFINFGYWESLEEGTMSLKEREQASAALYQVVFDQFLLEDSAGLVVAEIGCGRGMGCGLLCGSEKINSITGVDLNEKQIERAEKINQSLISANPGKLNFQQGSGADTGLESNSLDVIYSVEASQHFPSFRDFLKEVDRVLKPDGCLALTTFFANDSGLDDILSKRFATIDSGVDHFRPLYEVKAECREMGFELVYEKSIGQNVFYGFDQWMSQLDSKDQEKWVSHLLTSFKEGLIDYNVLKYRKV